MNQFCIFITIYVVLTLTICADRVNIVVCPPEIHNADTLVQYRYNFLCDLNNFNCDLDSELETDNYLHYIFIVHDKNWHNAKTIIEKFSNCSAEPIFVDVKNTNINLGFVCSQSKTAIVFDLTEKIRENATGKCVEKTTNSHIISTCPDTLWISGTTDCSNSQSSTIVKVLRNSEINDVVGDQTYGKEFIRHKHLIIGTNHYPPFVDRIEAKDGSRTYTGMLFKALDKMANDLQFTYEVIEPQDKKFGIKENGTWNGLIQQLLVQETDIAIAPLTQTYARSTAVEFTASYYYETLGIMYQLTPDGDKLWRMFSLFPKIIWAATLVVLIFSSLFVWCINKHSAIPNNSYFNGFFSTLWFNTSCIVNQGGEIEPETWSVQNYLALFWLYVLAMLSIYSGGLIAMLTSSHITLPFKDLEGLSTLLEQGKFRACMQGSTAFHQAVLAGGGRYETLRKFFAKNQKLVTQDEENCKKLVLENSDIAYVQEMTVLKEFQKQHCMNNTLIILNDEFFPGFFSFAVAKNSPLDTVFSLATTQIVETGLIDAWKSNFSERPKFCKIYKPDDLVAASSNALSLAEVTGPFVLFGIGVAVATSGFVFELRRYIWKKKIKEKKKIKDHKLSNVIFVASADYKS